MQSRWLKLICRFWPGVLSFLLICLALVWFLNPQPGSITHIATQEKGDIRRVLSSPNGQYLAVLRHERGTIFIAGSSKFESGSDLSTLALIDLNAKQEVTSFKQGFDPFGFDPQSNLIWVEMEFEAKMRGHAKAKLMRFDPKKMQKAQISECTQPYDFGPERKKDFSMSKPDYSELFKHDPYPVFAGLHRFAGYREYSLLSPSGKTWLIPHYQQETVTYELIDTPTGRMRARLALPEIHVKSPFAYLLEAEFSNDGKLLLVQTQEEKGEEARFRVHWFDVETGQEINSFLLPGIERSGSRGASFSGDGVNSRMRQNFISENNSRLHRPLYFDKDHLIAETYYPSPGFYTPKLGLSLIKPSESKITSIELEELKAAPDKWQIKDEKAGRISSFLFECNGDENSKSLIISSQYEMNLYADHMGMFVPKFLPFQSIGVRSLADGKLENSFRLCFGDQDEDGYCHTTNTLLAHLPNQKILLKRNVYHPGGKIDEWIETVREWLKMDHRPNWTNLIYLLDTKTGKYDFTFPLKQNLDQALLLPSQTELLFFRSDDAGVWIDSYDCPLHKPWLLILSWSFGVALVITILIEATRWLKRWRASVAPLPQ